MSLSPKSFDDWKSQELLKITVPEFSLEACADAHLLAGEYVLQQVFESPGMVVWRVGFQPICGINNLQASLRITSDETWILQVLMIGGGRFVIWRSSGEDPFSLPLTVDLWGVRPPENGWPDSLTVEAVTPQSIIGSSPIPAGFPQLRTIQSAALLQNEAHCFCEHVDVPADYQWETLKLEFPGLWSGACCTNQLTSLTLTIAEFDCYWSGGNSHNSGGCIVSQFVYVYILPNTITFEPCTWYAEVIIESGLSDVGTTLLDYSRIVRIDELNPQGPILFPLVSTVMEDGCDANSGTVLKLTPMKHLDAEVCGVKDIRGCCPPPAVPPAPNSSPQTILDVFCCPCSCSDQLSIPGPGGSCGGSCASGVNTTNGQVDTKLGSISMCVPAPGSIVAGACGNNARTLFSEQVVSDVSAINCTCYKCDGSIHFYLCRNVTGSPTTGGPWPLQPNEYIPQEGNSNRMFKTGSGWLEIQANKDRYQFNSVGKLSTIQKILNSIIHTWTFTSNAVIEPNGLRTTYTFNGSGKIRRMEDPWNRVTTFTVDGSGNLTGQVTPELCTTTLRYDGSNRLAAQIDCAGLRTTYAYDANSKVKRATTPTGGIYSYVYPAAGGVTRVIEPGTAITTVKYDDLGVVRSITSPTGQRTTYQYGAGFKTKDVSPSGVITTYTYQLLDDTTTRVKLTITPSGRTTNVYDVANSRLAATINPLGGRTSYVYNANGGQVAVIDPFSNRTTSIFDGTTGLLKATVNPLNQRSTTVYNALLQVSAQIDPLGNRTTFLYSNGQRSVTIDPLGRRSTTIYDLSNRVLAEVQPNAARTSYLYDSDSRKIAMINPAGYRTSQLYQATNLLASIDPFSQRTTYAYDLQGRLRRTTDPLGRISTTLYDASNRQIASITPLLARTTTLYNTAGQTTATINPLGFRTSQVYDSSGRPKATINPLGFRTTTVYDAAGMQAATINPLGFRTSAIYDTAMRSKATINELGRRTTTVYDAAGRTLASINPLSQRTTSVYDNAGRNIGMITPLGFRSTMVYNTASDVIAQIQPLLQRTSLVYNTKGQLSYTMDPLTHRTTSLYDSAGRNVASIMPLGFRSTMVYDKSRTVAQIDANSNRATTVYDALGRDQATVDASSDRTTRVYDAGGRTIAQINELNKRWSMTYDLGNQQTQQIDPLNRRQTFTYDNAGRRQTRKDARGNVITYVYDKSGKTTGRQYPDGSRATFAYDAAGSRTLMANAGGRYTTTYDELGRRKSVATPMAKRLTYTYDANSRLTQLQAADAGVFTYAYDSNSRLSYVRNPQNERTTFTYDDDSRRTLKKLSNGSRTTYSYDAANRLVRLANVKSSSVTISSFDNRYDNAGYRTMILDADGARTTYSYDNTYQLTEEHRSGSNSYIITYVYDKAGNRTLKNETGTRTTTVYDNANQIVYALDASGRTTYSYDNDGNQTRILTPAGARTTTIWDYDNRTTLIRLPSGARNTMTYDPEGLRTTLEESAGTTKVVYDGQTYLLETDNSNVLTAAYTQEPTTYGSLISQRRGSTTSWYIFDATDTTRHLLDGSQNLTDTYLYDAFGNVLNSSGGTVNPFQWHGAVGYYRDEDTGLYYVRARIINPRIAVFTAADPLLFVNGMNLYRLYFVPMSVDPSGTHVLFGQIAFTLENRFAHWITKETIDGAWWSQLPKCPCWICIDSNDIASSPDNLLWLTPTRKKDFRKSQAWQYTPGLGALNPLDKAKPSLLGNPPDLHPGAVWDMRTANRVGDYGNQCTFDNQGKLIDSGMGAGTVDKRYYGKADYDSFTAQAVEKVQEGVDMIAHFHHDVAPFWAAWVLDNGAYGNHVDQYLRVRPFWGEKCDGVNSPCSR